MATTLWMSVVLFGFVLLLSRTDAEFLKPFSMAVYPFQNPSLPIPMRVSNLISLLTLDEKLSLVFNQVPPIPRLNIPRYDFGQECLHGLVNRRNDLTIDGRATAFPQSIGLAASWNVSALHEMGRIIGDEAHAKRNLRIMTNDTTSNAPTYLMCWTPVVNILKDPRWGRSAETYGESPLLTYRLTSSLLAALHGDDSRYIKIASVLKHYTVYDGPEEGRFGFDAAVTDVDLYDTFNYVYRRLIEEKPSHIRGMMASYTALNGVPVAADFDLLTKQPVFDWGWTDGHIVSDCDAVQGIWDQHHYVQDIVDAAALSLLAGMDIDCGEAFESLGAAIDRGLISEADIDAALSATINIQMLVGFYDPFGLSPYDGIPPHVVDSSRHRKSAVDIAHQTMILLKNDQNILPLKPVNLQRLAVIGPTANDTNEYEQCIRGNGGSCLLFHIYHAYTNYLVQPLVGIEEFLAQTGQYINVTYARGCERYGSDTSGFADALAAAKGVDAIIFVGGLDYYQEEEDTDRGTLELPSIQQQLLTQLATLGAPIITVLAHGGALSDPLVERLSSALLSIGYPGQATGTALADIIFGEVNPSARLPYTVYTDTTQMPALSDYHLTDAPGRTYTFLNDTPRHLFGDGLSYTTYKYSSLTVRQDITNAIIISVTVANTGEMDGSEVVQVYAAYDANFVGINDTIVAELSVPRRFLLTFDKVFLAAHDTVHVQFNVSTSELTAFGRWLSTGKVNHKVDALSVTSYCSHNSSAVCTSAARLTHNDVRQRIESMRIARAQLNSALKNEKRQQDPDRSAVSLPVWISVGGCQPTHDRIASGVVLVQQLTVTATPQTVAQSSRLQTSTMTALY